MRRVVVVVGGELLSVSIIQQTNSYQCSPLAQLQLGLLARLAEYGH